MSCFALLHGIHKSYHSRSMIYLSPNFCKKWKKTGKEKKSTTIQPAKFFNLATFSTRPPLYYFLHSWRKSNWCILYMLFHFLPLLLDTSVYNTIKQIWKFYITFHGGLTLNKLTMAKGFPWWNYKLGKTGNSKS